MIWGSSPLSGVAAKRFAAQLNENAKYPGIAGELPEASHNQVVAFDGPFAPGTRLDAESGYPLRLILLSDPAAHPAGRPAPGGIGRTGHRPGHPGLGAGHGGGASAAALRQCGSAHRLCDGVSLGIASGVDPTPIEIIQELKERIS